MTAQVTGSEEYHTAVAVLQPKRNCRVARLRHAANGSLRNQYKPTDVAWRGDLPAPRRCKEKTAIPDTNFGQLDPSIPAPRSVGRFNSARLHRLIASSRAIRSLSIGLLARLELAFLAGHKRPDMLANIRRARSGRESLLSGNEAFTLYSLARAQAALGGEMAEVGVYQGCSARMISLASGGAPLHLFDTFRGLPEPEHHEHDRMREGHYAASLEGVRAYMADRPDVSFYPGLFPQTAHPVEGKRFSFVHLDVDLRAGTLACLEFFYPRMLAGGIIVTHDYSYLDGVRAAFDEFLAGRRERAIELPSSQAMLVKL